MNPLRIKWKMLLHVLIAITLFLVTSVLLLAANKPNIRQIQTRHQEPVQILYPNEYEEVEDPEAPAGIRRIYRMTVPEDLEHDINLGFYLFHQYANVYLDSECIYQLEASGSLPMIKTPGYNWVIVPIYREDRGKEIQVEILPVYLGADDEDTRFLLGESGDIILRELKQGWSKLTICEFLMFLGILLLMISVYYYRKYKIGVEICAFGVVALFLGLWRYTDARIMPFLFPERPILLYLLSFSCMMMGMVPLVVSQKHLLDQAVRRQYIVFAIVITGIAFLGQWLGLVELRQFILLYHGAYLALFVYFLVCLKKKDIRESRTYTWTAERISIVMFCLGAFLDLYFFYIVRTEERTVFTLWAMLFYIIVETFYLVVRFAKQKDQLAEQSRKIVQIRISSMMTQIRSHFVFNVLNAISGMCKYDPEKADETIVCFSRYLRNNINLMEQDEPVPFDTILSQMEDYIQLEQVRFGDRIRCRYEIGIRDFFMPPLILQPIVENALKHGILPKEEGGTLTLRSWEEKEEICVSLSDDGVGFSMDEKRRSGSVGMKNVETRLAYTVGGTIQIHSEPGNGTVVTIHLPKNTGVLTGKSEEGNET